MLECEQCRHQARVLNTRQVEILEHLATGASTSRIAAALYLSPQTVSYHITQMLGQFQVESRTGLVARAYHYGVLDVTHWPPRVNPQAGRSHHRPPWLDKQITVCHHRP